MKYKCIVPDARYSILYQNISFFTVLTNPPQSHITVWPTKYTREIYFTFNSLFDCDNQLKQQKTWHHDNDNMTTWHHDNMTTTENNRKHDI